MKNDKIIYTEYEMHDGEHISMSVAQILLLKLRGSNKEAYKRISKVLMGSMQDEDVLSMYQFLYDAYLCANQDEGNTMSFEKFLEDGNQSVEYNASIMQEMVQPRKKQNSGRRSKER